MNVYEVPVIGTVKTDKTVSVKVPGSKSITNRALLIAAMAMGRSVLKGCLFSDDSRRFLECLKGLGFDVAYDEKNCEVAITGRGGVVPEKKAEIYVGSAGTAARFLVAMLAFNEGEYTVNSSEQMKKRPMLPLIETLRLAGAEIECLEEEGHFPLKIKGIKKDCFPETVTVNIDKSSQFLSALLIASGTAGKAVEIKIEGSHGMAYVNMTVEMMKSFGVSAEKRTSDGLSYCVSGKEGYSPRVYEIEPDMSAASYFYAFAAVTGAKITVPGVHTDMLQGDVRFLEVLEEMGCALIESDGTLTVEGPEDGKLKGGFTVDMSAFSDQALTLAAIAPFADGSIEITGISHIRLQECDRINAIVKNLKAMGVRVYENKDGVLISVGKNVPDITDESDLCSISDMSDMPDMSDAVHGADIETFDDHRVAMAFSLTGLRIKGIRILNPECCAKTFKEYFSVLDGLCQKLSAFSSDIQ